MSVEYRIKWNPIKIRDGVIIGEVPDVKDNEENKFLLMIEDIDTGKRDVCFDSWDERFNKFNNHYILGELDKNPIKKWRAISWFKWGEKHEVKRFD